MLQIIRVTGSSLAPEYQAGDFLLAAKIPILFRTIRSGAVVVFRHPIHGLMVKRVERRMTEKGALFVVGDHPDSVDSRQFGPIPLEAVLGQVIWHIRRPR